MEGKKLNFINDELSKLEKKNFQVMEKKVMKKEYDSICHIGND